MDRLVWVTFEKTTPTLRSSRCSVCWAFVIRLTCRFFLCKLATFLGGGCRGTSRPAPQCLNDNTGEQVAGLHFNATSRRFYSAPVESYANISSTTLPGVYAIICHCPDILDRGTTHVPSIYRKSGSQAARMLRVHLFDISCCSPVRHLTVGDGCRKSYRPYCTAIVEQVALCYPHLTTIQWCCSLRRISLLHGTHYFTVKRKPTASVG